VAVVVRVLLTGVVLVEWLERLLGGRVSDKREVEPPAPASLLSGTPAGSLCEGCGRLHPPEALPVELLLAGGVEVNLARWFGGRRA
jgi:hypothetical protein